MGIFGKANSKTTLPQFHVPSSVYGKAIPVIMGRVRANLILIFAGNFASRSTNNKKGKGTKKLGNVQAYSFAGDYLLGYSPMAALEHVWMNKDTFFGVLPTSQTYNLVGTFGNGNNGFASASGTVTTSPGIFGGIFAITWLKPFSVTYNDYGGPGSVSLSGNENEPLYNGFSAPLFEPIGGLANQLGVNACSYGPITQSTPTGGTSWVVNFDPPVTNPQITVWFFYAEPQTGGQLPFSVLGMQFEDMLGNGSEFSFPGGSAFDIIYPEFAGVGVPFVDCGASNTAPSISVGVVGYQNLFSTGDTTPADVILDIILSGNAYVASGNYCWQHGLGFSTYPGDINGSGLGDILVEPQILDDPPKAN